MRNQIAKAACMTIAALLMLYLSFVRRLDVLSRLEDAGVTIAYSYGILGYRFSNDEVPHNSRFRGFHSFAKILSYNQDRPCTVPVDEMLAVRDLKHIQNVTIANATSDAPTMERLCRLNKVSVISFWNCRITDIALQHLAMHPEVAQIRFVSCSGFSIESLGVFSQSRNLRRISVNGTFATTPADILKVLSNESTVIVSVDGYSVSLP